MTAEFWTSGQGNTTTPFGSTMRLRPDNRKCQIAALDLRFVLDFGCASVSTVLICTLRAARSWNRHIDSMIALATKRRVLVRSTI